MRAFQTGALALAVVAAIAGGMGSLTPWSLRMTETPARIMRVTGRTLLALAAVSLVGFLIAVAIAGGVQLEPR